MPGRKKHAAANHRPILVTGANRSGTTWVGRILASARGVNYIHEPFNHQYHDPAFGLIPPPFAQHYHYVLPNEAEGVKRYLRYRMGHLRPWWSDVKDRPGLRRLAGASRRWLQARRAAFCRPLLKDPIALMSAEWLWRTFDLHVVVLVRHPAAYVSSIRRLNWPMRPHVFLNQPELMRDLLAPLTGEITAQHARANDPIGDAICAWNVFHHVIDGYRRRHANWIFLRHEDLSRNYGEMFEALFEKLGLDFGKHPRKVVEQLCNAANPAEAGGRVHRLNRNSRAVVWNWKKRLDREQIARIKSETDAIASRFYAPSDW